MNDNKTVLSHLHVELGSFSTVSVVSASLIAIIKKNPAKRPGNKGGTGLGMPVPMARNGEGTGLRRATAYSQKSTPVINRYPDTN